MKTHGKKREKVIVSAEEFKNMSSSMICKVMQKNKAYAILNIDDHTRHIVERAAGTY